MSEIDLEELRQADANNTQPQFGNANREELRRQANMLDTGRAFKQMPNITGEESVVLQNFLNGVKKPSRGLLRVFANIADRFGVEGAARLLEEMEMEQNMSEARTAKISEDAGGRAFVGQMLGETVGFPFGGGAGGKLLSAFKSFVANAAGGGLTSAGEMNDPGEVALDAGVAGSFGTALDAAGNMARSTLLKRRQAQVGGDMSEELTPLSEVSVKKQEQRTEEILEGEQALGVNLLTGQRTQEPYQLRALSILAELPQTGKVAYDSLRAQNDQVTNAVERLLGDLGTEEGAEISGAQTSRLAGSIIAQAENYRTRQTDPLFRGAFSAAKGSENPFYPDLNQVENLMAELLTDAVPGGKISTNLKTLAEQLGLGEQGAPPKSLEYIHNVKLEIDELLDAQGSKKAGKNLRRALTLIKNDLVNTMELYPGYRDAMNEFRRLSPAIDNLKDGKIGQLADLDPKQYKNVSKILFDAAETNPGITKNTIRMFQAVDQLPGYNGVGSQIVRNLLRSEINRRMNSMRVDVLDTNLSAGVRAENIPAQLKSAIFGNAGQRKVLFTALKEADPNVVSNFVWLEKILDRASTGRPGGSDTAIKTEVLKRMQDVGVSTLRNIFRRPIDTATNIGEQAMIDARMDAFADALFDPDFASEMKNIKKSGYEKGWKKFDNLVANVLDLNLKYQPNRFGTMNRAGTVGLMSEGETADFYYDPEDDQIHSNGMQ